MGRGIHRFRKKPRKSERNKRKLMNTRGGILPKPKVRKRK